MNTLLDSTPLPVDLIMIDGHLRAKVRATPNLRELQRELGLSDADYQRLSHFQRGANIGLDLLSKLCAHFMADHVIVDRKVVSRASTV